MRPLNPHVAYELQYLLSATRGGCRTAAARLFQEYRPLLVLLAEREIPPNLRAKVGLSDIVQDTLLAAHRDLPGFMGDTEAEFLAWLRQILVHQAINQVNRFRTGKRDVGRELSLDDSRVRGAVADQLAESDPTPSTIIRQGEQREALVAGLDCLSQDARQVILFRHRDRQSYAEIARRMGKSEVAVRQLWTRGVKRLQLELRAHDEVG
jgi:RNA polymerase sigma-70 factor (ECF subfamily)